MHVSVTSLEQIVEIEPISAITQAARADIDSLLWRRDIRAAAAEVAKASVARGGMDSAALEGADLAGVENSPMGRVLTAALAATSHAPTFADTWTRTPLQAITSLHLLVAKDFVAEDELARPRAGDSADDPLHIGQLPFSGDIPSRLLSMTRSVATAKAPAIIEAGFVHAEIMSMRPFTWGSGLVARSLVRTVLAARGNDPSNFSIPENGMFETGRTAYVTAIRDYSQGTIDGVTNYFNWFATCLGLGARAVVVPD